MEALVHYPLLRKLIIDVLLSRHLELRVLALALIIVMLLMAVTAGATN